LNDVCGSLLHRMSLCLLMFWMVIVVRFWILRFTILLQYKAQHVLTISPFSKTVQDIEVKFDMTTRHKSILRFL